MPPLPVLKSLLYHAPVVYSFLLFIYILFDGYATFCLFIYQLVIYCFQYSAAVDIYVHIFVYTYNFLYLKWMPSSMIDSYCNFRFSFLKTANLFGK